MHRAAAATIPMTIPVVLLDSRTTSEGPGSRLTPGSVGSAVGILWNMGEIIKAPLLCALYHKGCGQWKQNEVRLSFGLRLFSWTVVVWRVAAEAEVVVVRLWSALCGSRRIVRSKSLGTVSFVANFKARRRHGLMCGVKIFIVSGSWSDLNALPEPKPDITKPSSSQSSLPRSHKHGTRTSVALDSLVVSIMGGVSGVE